MCHETLYSYEETHVRFLNWFTFLFAQNLVLYITP